MAYNESNINLEIWKFINVGDLVLAFCLSMLVGLLIGALIYILLTWMSRRRASARITQRPKQQRSGATRSHNNRMGLYRSTMFERRSDNNVGPGVLSLYRQPSVEPVGPLGSKPSYQASTFRPAPKGSRGLGSGDDNQATLPHDTVVANSEDSTLTASLVPGKRNSFWLGNKGLRGFLPSQAPPPAYDSVILAFQETCT
ncbi:myc target protein 1 homolog [Osmerus mordax]|uniref:myc target protein 1 homolog n=1 Tax=Osmerus mordax TaxID=8014 RepID=UPI00350F5863